MQVTQEQIGVQLYPGCMLMHAETMPKHPEISIGFIPCLYPLLLCLPVSQHHKYTATNVTVRVNHKQATTAGNMSLLTVTGTLVLSTLRQGAGSKTRGGGGATAGQTILCTSECTTQGAQHLRTFFIQNCTAVLNRREHSVYL